MNEVAHCVLVCLLQVWVLWHGGGVWSRKEDQSPQCPGCDHQCRSASGCVTQDKVSIPSSNPVSTARLHMNMISFHESQNSIWNSSALALLCLW